MASITTGKRKGGRLKYYISHRYLDDTGKQRQKQIPCKDKKEALLLLDDVNESEKAGLEYIRPIEPQAYVSPSLPASQMKSARNMTVSELLEKYVVTKCAEDWEAGTLSTSTRIINNYIEPYIGSLIVAGITTQILQDYYNDLPNHYAVKINHKNAKPKLISARTVHEVHKILRPALSLAAQMGIIEHNPALSVKKPKTPKYRRKQWTEEVLEQALSLCNDTQMRLLILLMFSCTVRSGELSGLSWDCVNMSEEAIVTNTACVTINKTVRRLNKADIDRTRERNIIYVFPNIKPNATTSTVIKGPKTESSIRTVFLTEYVTRQLIEYKAIQDLRIAEVGEEYHDHGYQFVFTQLNGRPYDVNSLSKKFKRFIRENNLPEVDAYSLRHTGSTYKLRKTGNIKAVQGDMGHASPEMLTKVYAAIVDEDRKNIASLIQEQFFSKLANDNDKSVIDG